MPKKKSKRVIWEEAWDVKKDVLRLVNDLRLDWIKPTGLYFIRSNNSQSRAYARIWGLSKVWQMTLNLKPAYILEVLSEHFDHLPRREKDKVLLHELTHIPKNFSGSLMPHIRKRGKRNFHSKVEELFARYLRTQTEL